MKVTRKATTSESVILEACDNDPDVVEFYAEWIKQGKDATKAYLAIYPHVTRGSASVLGHRMLSRVNRRLIMESYGLTEDLYLEKLHEGVYATKTNEFTGEEKADHNARKYYHGKLGELIGWEVQEKGGVTVNNYTQNNFSVDPSELKEFTIWRDEKRRKEIESD